jgi:hypothetical protein
VEKGKAILHDDLEKNEIANKLKNKNGYII